MVSDEAEKFNKIDALNIKASNGEKNGGPNLKTGSLKVSSEFDS